MKQVLFIRPDTREDGKIWWCESGSDRISSLAGHPALNTLAEHALAKRVCLLLPASEMVFRHFTLPGKGISAQATPFSWMAEETLIGDVDDLHWTVLGKKGREVDAVAIAAERLQHWLSLFDAAGLKVIQVLPDAILLPVDEGGCTLAALEDSYWLRFSSSFASEADSALLPLLMSKTGAGSTRCYGPVPHGIEVDEPLAWQHPLALIQPQWKRCRANMLHGGFAIRGGNSGMKHAGKAIAVVALLSVGLLIGPRLAMAWMLLQQENQMQDDIAQIYQHYFPSLRQQSNIKYHFGQNIKKQKKGVFLQLDELAGIKQAVPAMEISQVEYDGAREQLTLSVKSQDPQSLQTFVNQAGDNFEFSLQPVSDKAPWTAMVTGKHK